MSENRKRPHGEAVYIFHLRLSDGWTILVPAKTREYEWDFSPITSKKQHSYSNIRPDGNSNGRVIAWLYTLTGRFRPAWPLKHPLSTGRARTLNRFGYSLTPWNRVKILDDSSLLKLGSGAVRQVPHPVPYSPVVERSFCRYA